MREPAIALNELVVRQWDAYEGQAEPAVSAVSGVLAVPAPSAEEALTALLDWMERRGLTELVTTTQLLITPGYDWKIAKGLITNFHQPQSTLLLLIASLVGPAWRDIYAYALAHGFRFLSYGDGCLLWGDQTLK
jgi:S-adenosylmethionine:tRNA ribosyltransferase-isomerase